MIFEKLFNLRTKTKYIIISILVLCILIFAVLFLLLNQNPPGQSQNTPTEIPVPTFMPSITPGATVPPDVLPELQYPVIFEDMTIEFYPRSGTFIVYYKGDLSLAQFSYSRFMQRLTLIESKYNVEYRSLDPVTPVPHSQLDE